MSFAKRVAVAISLNEPLEPILESIRLLDFIKDCDVHFLNVSLTTTYAIGLGESAIIYPLEDDQKIIREQTVQKLHEIKKHVLPHDFKGTVIAECLFSDDPKRKFCEYVDEMNIDTVIVAAREKRGLFESSFTHYLAKHTRANIIILKHRV